MLTATISPLARLSVDLPAPTLYDSASKRRSFLITVLASPITAQASSGIDLDANLVRLALDLRASDDAYGAALDASGDTWEGPEIDAAIAEQDALKEAMAGTPAVGLAGIAAKVARLCWAIDEHGSGSLCVGDIALAASLARDVARLLPNLAAAMAPRDLNGSVA